MVRRVIGFCLGWLLIGAGGWVVASSAASAPACSSRAADLLISAPTTLDGLQLSGQRVRIAAALTINGSLGGCAASFDLMPGASLHAASIDLVAGQVTLDRGSLTSAGPLRLDSQRLIVRDAAGQPLLIAGAGTVELTGVDLLDLRTVADRSSMIRAGADLVLRSDWPIRGDAHYLAGGAVRLETLDGAPADVFSPDDPIVLAQGDVSLGNYSGASLHVLAGGRAQLGNITITGSDTQANSVNPSNATLFNASTRISALAPVPLTSGITVTVDGSLRPTLDVRAGLDWASLGGLGSNQIIPGGSVSPVFSGSTGAAIITGDITVSVANGVVLLTSQYRPKAGLSGDVTTGNIVAPSAAAGANGGNIWIDSRGGVATGLLRTFATAAGGSGGPIWVRAAAGNIVTDLLQSYSSTGSGNTGVGGSITLSAPAGSVQVTGSINTSVSSGDGQSANGGAVSIIAGGAISGNPAIYTNSYGAAGSATGGAVNLTSTGPIDLDAIITYSHFAAANSSGSGNGGAITLLARNAGGQDGADGITLNYIYADSGGYFADVSATGASSNGGAVSLRTEDGPITVENWIWTPSVARGGTNNTGNGGSVALTAGNGGISLGPFGIGAYTQLVNSSGNAGRGGNVSLVAAGPIQVDVAQTLGGITATSTSGSGNSFGGGNVLVVTNQGGISFGDNNIDTRASGGGNSGNGGNVTMVGAATPAGSMKFNAALTDSSTNAAGATAGSAGRISLASGGPLLIKDSLYARSSSPQGVAGSGGAVLITTATTATLNTIQAQVDSLSGSGDGGDVSIETAGRVKITNIFAWSRFTGSGYSGDAGDTRISVHNSGPLDGADDLELAVVWSDSGTWYGNNLSIGPSGDGGDCILTVEDGDALIAQWLWMQSLTRGAGFASGNGGEVRVQASGQIRIGDFGINTLSQSVNASSGKGGDVKLDAGSTIKIASTSSPIAIRTQAIVNTGSAGNAGSITLETPGSIDLSTHEVLSQSFSANGQSGNGGAITLHGGLQASAAITTGMILSYSQAAQKSGNGGAISIQGGRVRTSHIQASAQATIGLAGAGGAISVAADTYPGLNNDITSHSQGVTGSGLGGDIDLSAGGPLTLRSLYSYSRSSSSGSSGNGGAISIHSLNRGGLDGGDAIAIFTVASDSGAFFASPLAVSTGNAGAVSIEAADGPIAINQPIYAMAVGRNAASSAGNGGAVTLLAPHGSITLASGGLILTSSEAIDASGAVGSGGGITIQSGGDFVLPGNGMLSSAALANAGLTGGGGAILIEVAGSITAPSATIQTVSSATSGAVGPAGDLTLLAGGSIQVGALRTSAQRSSGPNGPAGDILIATPGSVTALYASASAFSAQPGVAGTVTINAGQLVRLTGSNSGASVLASGIAATGAISITHGGGGITPFVVGNASVNGSADKLLTSAAAINPTRAFLYSYTEAPNIHLISVPAPALGLAKSVAPASPVPYHGALSYTLTISNTGSAAAGVLLTDTLPLGLLFDHWISQPVGASVASNTVTWSGAVAQNATFSLSFVATHTGTAGQILTNTAQLAHSASFFSASASATATVEPALSAQAGPDQSVDEGDPVQFSGAASSPPDASAWNFGDGSVITAGLSATHSYQDNGVYTATLTVTSTSGLVASDTLVVTVANVAPQAQAGPDQTLTATPGGTLVTFSGGLSDPGALDTHTLAWDFGDGQIGSGAAPAHTYATPGTYTATLTVTDDDGGQDSDTLTVTISAEPVVQLKIYLPLLIR